MSAQMPSKSGGGPAATPAAQPDLPGGLNFYPSPSARRRAQAGVAVTYVLWGLMPLYWALIPPMPAFEMVLHRMVWTTLCSLGVVLYQKKLGATLALLSDKRNLPILLGSSLLILANHLIYIWAIINNQVVEASLGYFLMPIMHMGFGIILFKDRTTFMQKMAIALAVAGVSVQIILLGRLPLVALGLALTFCAYTALKKMANYGTGPGLFWETAAVAPLAAAAIIWLEWNGQGHAAAPLALLLLMGTGPLTTFPFLWFSYGARRLSLIFVGLLQYITPIMTLLLGVFWFKEGVSQGQLASFAFIVLALLLYSVDSLRSFRLAERLARRHRLFWRRKLLRERRRERKSAH